ncbi:asparaginase [Rhodococcus opacus]|uniref:Putative L-asparaginase n=1 Tax=Rhodococcus opacus (strain B4) TaxID=632772 RepID=C1B6A9_RHOOB|nr:asparaginase [Rhodococcus opacus]BAH51212.1 putative L-asparaginase [Rhodococcus opacus B4]
MDHHRRIALCTLGGTIAAQPHPTSGAGVVPGEISPSLGTATVLSDAGVEVSERRFGQVASAAVDFGTIREVLTHAEQEAERGAAGIVVTCGTDMLEEFAFALDVQWSRPIPLVATGAMRHPGLPSADGPANLTAALRIASEPSLTELGCLVVMNDRIHSPWQLQKRHTSNADAFTSVHSGPVGEVCENLVHIYSPPARRPSITVPFDAEFPPVAVLKTALADDGRILEPLVALGYRGLVVEAAGGGSVPPAWATPLGKLAREIPVLYATRTGAGPALRSTYGGTGAEIDLQNRGLIPAGTLDGLKARVLLTVLLAAGADEKEIRHALEGYTTSTCNASAQALDAI